MQNKNLKLKLGLCGLALTSFLALNAHSTVHADTVQNNNANNNAITWDSDSDDSQVVKEEPQQQTAPQSVQKQSTVQASQSQPVQNKKVMVSDVSSENVNAEKRLVTSSKVTRPLTNNVATSQIQSVQNDVKQQVMQKSVQVSNVDSDAQMPVQTQIVAQYNKNVKYYHIVLNARNPQDPTYHTTTQLEHDSERTGGWLGPQYVYAYGSNRPSDADIKKNPDIYGVNPNEMLVDGNSPTDSSGFSTGPAETTNGLGVSWATQELVDTGQTYNNQKIGILIIPRWSEYVEGETWGSDGYPVGLQGTPWGDAGFLPAVRHEWTTGEIGGYGVDVAKQPVFNYSYTAIPIDLNTGNIINGVKLMGTSLKGHRVADYYDLNSNFLTNSDPSYGTTITGGTLSTDPNQILPGVKTLINDIKAGKVQPDAVATDHIEYDPHVFTDPNSADYKYNQNTIIPEYQNLMFLAIQTREVNPNNPNAKKQAKRIIHLNFPNGVKPASYNNIVDKDNNVVQTVTFTRSGTENLADGSVKWGPWQGDGKFASVTLPDIPGYTMTMN